jgi:hypothetical protein
MNLKLTVAVLVIAAVPGTKRGAKKKAPPQPGK